MVNKVKFFVTLFTIPTFGSLHGKADMPPMYVMHTRPPVQQQRLPSHALLSKSKDRILEIRSKVHPGGNGCYKHEPF